MAQHSFTVTGNLTANPHYHRTGERQGVCKFRLGASRQRRGEDNNWQSLDQLWLNVECWGQLAENARRSLAKGMSVIVVGTLVTHQWKDANGISQSYAVLKATHIGPDLNRYLTNSIVPPQRVVQADASATMPDAVEDLSWVDSSSYIVPPAETQGSDAADTANVTTAADERSAEGKELVAVGDSGGGGEPPF